VDDQFSAADFPDIDAATIATMGTTVSLGPIAAKLPYLTRALVDLCPVKAAAAFAGLLLQKRLQSNCARLELLVHLCLSIGGGTRAPTQGFLLQGFTSMGTLHGYMEDPREDNFVGNIYSKRGNYRVLEGIWEGATFYLQRIVNMVDTLPEQDHFKVIADAIHALLKLSDIVCERAGLTRNDIGLDGRNRDLPKGLREKVNLLRNLVAFSTEDLLSYGLDVDALSPFIFDPSIRHSLLDQAISNTDLEAAPVVIKDGVLNLLLPTAVSVAIRRFFVRALGDQDNRDVFLRQLGFEYSRLFSTSPFFGNPGPRLPFSHNSLGSLSALIQEIDTGRYLVMLFFLDDLVGFQEEGFGGVFQGSPALSEEIDKVIQSAQEDCERRDGFKEGMTLVVGCGIGRGALLEGPYQAKARWEWKFVSAPDFHALAQFKDIRILDLLRVFRMEQLLRQNEIRLQNMNGLLNLFAWVESLDGHLVPHAEIPRDFSAGQKLNIVIPQNGLGDLRHNLALAADEHVEQFVDGTWKLVRREEQSFFEEDASRPLYVHLSEGKEPNLLGARITSTRSWWYEAVAKDGSRNHLIYERWSMMGVWIARIADQIDAEIGARISSGPIFWRCSFDGEPSLPSVDNFGQHEDLDAAFAVSVDLAARTIQLEVGAGFDRATYHQHNIAEVGLVRAFLRGVSTLTNVPLVDLEAALTDRLSDVNARHTHMFSARSYRDYISDTLPRSPVMISRFDDASLKLGLGWRVRDPKEGDRLVGKQDCLSFLRSLIDQLLDELASFLKLFDRESLLTTLLINYESASFSRDRWHRTAAAILALREDKAAALDQMSKHEFKLNGVLQPTRNLVEMVLCESPLGKGERPGKLDLAWMLAQSSQIFHLSGWYDLIRWDVLEPSLAIRPLGDVHTNHDFMDMVIEPFSKASSEYRYSASINQYATSLGSVPLLEDSRESDISTEFLDAWQDEFGVSLDAYRRFLDALENYGIEHHKILFILPRSSLIALADTTDVGLAIVNSLELTPRPAWHMPPDGYAWKDIAPARFKRRLGLLRRPLIQLDSDDDPKYFIDPALIREGFSVMLRNYYAGEYSDDHLGPAMLKYAGAARARDGAEFNKRVATTMKELGWQIEREIKLTKILQKGLDRDYGDVDVLAWKPESGRILIMECKDLQFKKTYGEIAEQLSDYRGFATPDGKKRDSLRKHLDRVDVLRAHPVEVARFLHWDHVDKLESHLIFSHPVPMMFANALDRNVVAAHTYDSLGNI